MSTSIPISGLNVLSSVTSSDFIPIVNDSSLTTFRTPLLSLSNWISSSVESSSSLSSISSSWVNSASFSVTSLSSSYAQFSLISISASWASASLSAVSASWASTSLSSANVESASWASASLSAVSASWASASLSAVSASWASASLSSSYSQTASYASSAGGSITLIIPTGMIAPFAMQSPPNGWLNCSGSSVLVADYTDLASAIYVGNTLNATAVYGYKSTDVGGVNRNTGGNYIKLPDLRGLFIRGYSFGSSYDTARTWASRQSGSLGNHVHSYTQTTIQTIGMAGSAVQHPIENINTTVNTGNPVINHGVVGSSGAGNETVPANITMMYCIKT